MALGTIRTGFPIAIPYATQSEKPIVMMAR